jgi:hypothetical protein
MPNPIPATPDAERHLLGVLIRDGLPFPPDLLSSDFNEPSHQEVASVFVQMWADGIQPDELTVTQRLREAKATTGAHEVNQLVKDVGESHYRLGWADIVRQQSVLRHLARTAEKVAALASDPAADPDALLAYAEGSFKAVQGRYVKRESGPQRMDFDALLAADRKNDPNSVIGNRWLCKGGSLLIVGQSGTGKSSLMMQAAVHWSLGRDFFGIKPKKALRSIILQAENDAGDVAEALQDVVAGAYITADEKEKLRDNLSIFRDTVSTGTAFTDALKGLILSHRADIVFVDPLLSFAGIDISDQEQASHFLRHDLAPILLETGAILVAMHHTGKPKSASDKEGQTVADLAYAGLGSSEFTNYFREVAVLFRCQGEDPIYKFGLTKRRGRANLQNAQGQFKHEINIRHAREDGVIRWEYAHTETEVVQQEAIPSPAKGSTRPNPPF